MAPLSWQSNQANFMNGLEREQDQDCFIEEQVRTDRLHQLFRQSFAAIFGSYLAAVMLCWLCWDRFDHQVILVWLGALAVSSLLRVKMFMEWFRCPNAERTPKRWDRIVALAADYPTGAGAPSRENRRVRARCRR